MDPGYLSVGTLVEVLDVDAARAAGDVGRQGTVLEVRRYPDGEYRYGLGYMVDGGMGGLYPAGWLRPAGGTRTDLVVNRQPRSAGSVRVSEEGEVRGLDTDRGEQAVEADASELDP